MQNTPQGRYFDAIVIKVLAVLIAGMAGMMSVPERECSKRAQTMIGGVVWTGMSLVGLFL